MRLESDKRKKPAKNKGKSIYYSKTNMEPIEDFKPEQKINQTAQEKLDRKKAYEKLLKQYGYDYEYIDRDGNLE